MSGKSQTVGDFTVSQPYQILPTKENSYISPIVWNGRGLIWRIGNVCIFPTRPRFLRWSAIIPDKWKLKFLPSRTSAMDFAHYQSSKLLGSSPLTTHMASLRQTSRDYPIYRQNLGRSANSEIPNRLGFSRHMKTRLKAGLKTFWQPSFHLTPTIKLQHPVSD